MSDIYEKVFAPISHLKKHKLNHTKEKPFKCGIFEKIFRKMPELTSY